MLYENPETRLVQERNNASAADALNVQTVGPTDGKIWRVIGIGYNSSVAETQVVSFQKVSRAGTYFSILNPVSLNLNPSFASPLEYGGELMLLPGESLIARRVAATAGSVMRIWIQFVELDQPLYDYTEPQEAARVKRAGSMIRTLVSRGGGGGGGGAGPAGRPRGWTPPAR